MRAGVEKKIKNEMKNVELPFLCFDFFQNISKIFKTKTTNQMSFPVFISKIIKKQKTENGNPRALRSSRILGISLHKRSTNNQSLQETNKFYEASKAPMGIDLVNKL